MTGFILAVDAGTTSIRCILLDHDAKQLAMAQKPLTQYYPNPGWVEHDPVETWEYCKDVVKECLSTLGIDPDDCVACSITNQRETTVVWDRKTGEPVYNAIVWQDHRSSELCKELTEKYSDHVAEHCGLRIDSYFSATKIAWILDNVEGVRERAEKGELAFGTVDSWLLWNLSGRMVHATDISNASRTMLFDIRTLDWDDMMLNILNIPKSILPEVHPSGHRFGLLDKEEFGIAPPITGIIGDQQSSLFGQKCFEPGDMKITFGTGGFLLMNIGKNSKQMTDKGLLNTVAWDGGDGTRYALEGSFYIAGAAIQWLRDGLHLIGSSAEVNELASSVDDTNGCYIVPAFVGLGTPYWDPDAKGLIFGLTRGTTSAHLARATLEAIAYQSYDIIETMRESTATDVNVIRVDGGASKSDLICQFLADISGLAVERPKNIEATALGSATMAGLTVGFWTSEDELRDMWELEHRFEPNMSEDVRKKKLAGWRHAVSCALLR